MDKKEKKGFWSTLFAPKRKAHAAANMQHNRRWTI